MTTGVLAKTPLAHSVIYCVDRKLTGTLTLRPEGDGEASNTVVFFEGMPGKIKLADPVEPLGRLLVERGDIDEATYNATIVRLGPGLLHGEILRAAGKIDERTLDEALRTQVARKLGHLFWLPPSTRFEFTEGVDLLSGYGGKLPTPIDPAPVLWASMRANPSPQHLEATLQGIGSSALRLRASASLARFEFSPTELAILGRLQSPATLVQLYELSDPRIVQVLVSAMVLLRQIEVVPASLSARAMTVPPPRPSAIPPPAALPTPPSGLGSDKPASPVPAVGRASRPPSGSFQAQQPLAVPKKRSSKPPVPRDDGRRHEILARVQRLSNETHFEALGLTKDSTMDEARSAYMRLAMHWHPDRLAPDLADLHDAAAKVFGRISEAYGALTDPEKRARYLEGLTIAKGRSVDERGVQRLVGAANALQKAEFFLSKGMLGEAEPYAHKANELAPDEPDHVALLCYLESQRPDRAAAGYDDLFERLARVIPRGVEPSPRFRLFRARILRSAGRLRDAIVDFRAVAEADPRNLEAVREVRVYEMRNPSEKAKAPPSFLGLFGKKK